jgi:hypothetical protein
MLTAGSIEKDSKKCLGKSHVFEKKKLGYSWVFVEILGFRWVWVFAALIFKFQQIYGKYQTKL